jgi:hypothetical protein
MDTHAVHRRVSIRGARRLLIRAHEVYGVWYVASMERAPANRMDPVYACRCEGCGRWSRQSRCMLLRSRRYGRTACNVCRNSRKTAAAIERYFGKTFHNRRIVGARKAADSRAVYLARCLECGEEKWIAGISVREGGCRDCYLGREYLGPYVDQETEWEEDDRCWYVVSRHSDGLTMKQIGELMGVSKQRVEQIQNGAIRKLRAVPDAYEAFLYYMSARNKRHPLTEAQETIDSVY